MTDTPLTWRHFRIQMMRSPGFHLLDMKCHSHKIITGSDVMQCEVVVGENNEGLDLHLVPMESIGGYWLVADDDVEHQQKATVYFAHPNVNSVNFKCHDFHFSGKPGDLGASMTIESKLTRDGEVQTIGRIWREHVLRVEVHPYFPEQQN